MLCDQLMLRPATALDASQFVELMNSQYARKKDTRYFDWQYIHPCDPTILMCAFEAGKLCGMFGLKKRELNNGVVVGQVIDMLIVPTWRKKGLFRALAEEAVQQMEQELDIVCVLANAVGNYAVQKSLGYQHIGTIKTHLLKTSEYISGTSIEEDILNEGKDNVRFVKSQEYNRWRFDENPCYSYETICVKEATAWVKIFADPVTSIKYGDIVDIESSKTSATSLRGVLCAACDYLKLQNVKGITVWAMVGSLLREMAESIGFQESDQERYFCAKVLNPKCEYLIEFHNWRLVEADSEVF